MRNFDRKLFKKNEKNQLLRLIGLSIFIFILTKIDFQKIKDIIPSIRLPFLLAAVIFALFPVAIKAYRWHILLKSQQINYSFKNAFIAYLSSVFAGTITPGKLGELIKVFYIRKAADISFGKAFSSVIIDRILDLFFLLLFSLIGILYFYTYREHIAISVILISSCMLIMIFLLHKNLRNLIVNLLLKLTIKRYKTEMKIQTEEFLEGLEIVNRIQFLSPIFWTLIAYLMYFFNCFLISKSLNMPVSFIYLSFCMSITVTLVLLPVSIAGIGVRDASLIFLLWQVGISKEIALTYSFLFLVFINITAGLAGLFAWFKMPLDFRSEFLNHSKEGNQNDGNRKILDSE